MSAEQKFQDLMQQGWNLNIECKAKGREYEFTYEASGQLLDVRPLQFIHATGSTLNELADNLNAYIEGNATLVDDIIKKLEENQYANI